MTQGHFGPFPGIYSGQGRCKNSYIIAKETLGKYTVHHITPEGKGEHDLWIFYLSKARRGKVQKRLSIGSLILNQLSQRSSTHSVY